MGLVVNMALALVFFSQFLKGQKAFFLLFTAGLIDTALFILAIINAPLIMGYYLAIASNMLYLAGVWLVRPISSAD